MLRGDLGITLLVVHFNHGLRGAESEQDASFVAELARTRNSEFVLGSEDVATIADQNGWNLEDAGRRQRYAFFQQLVEAGRATRIAVAHTADDQAETVLAHILRGTGPAGLGGIHPAIGPVVRPLLGVRREELRSYLREIGQPWREDMTNKDLLRTRARIREQLLPLLQRDFSPQVVDRLSDLARLSREEAAFWSAFVEDRFRSLVRSDNGILSVATSDLLAPLGSSLGRAARPFDNRSKSAEFRKARDRAPDSQAIRNVARRLQGVRRRARGAGNPSCDGVVERAPGATPWRHPCGEAVRGFGFLACNRSETGLANS